MDTEVEVNGCQDMVMVRNRRRALYEAFSLRMLRQCHFCSKDKLHWKYMAHKVCQTSVHVWQSMKTCPKRKPKKTPQKRQKIWLMSGCVCHVLVRRRQRGGDVCTLWAFIMHILAGLKGIKVTVAAVHHHLIAT